MHQLDLFGYRAPAASPPAPPAPPEPEELLEGPDLRLLEPPEVLPGQLGLFADRTLRLGRARAAIAEGQLEEACRELAELRERYPTDLVVERESAQASRLRDRLAALEATSDGARAPLLLALAREHEGTADPWAQLRCRLLVRVAESLARAGGEACALEGQPPGFYLLESGAAAEAHASLTAAVALRRSARHLFLLGDAATALGDGRAARRAHLEALLLDPFDDALARVRDDAVRELPSIARDDLELEDEDEPAAWAAPVGILTGVLPLPAGLHEGGASLTEEADPGLPPGRREALARARRFVAALGAAMTAHARGPAAVIEARRAMKRSSPRLFEVYLDRVVRGRPG